jgi:hypothetical protein
MSQNAKNRRISAGFRCHNAHFYPKTARRPIYFNSVNNRHPPNYAEIGCGRGLGTSVGDLGRWSWAKREGLEGPSRFDALGYRFQL